MWKYDFSGSGTAKKKDDLVPTNMGEMMKAFGEMRNFMEKSLQYQTQQGQQLEDLGKRIQTIEDTPFPKKSITSSAIEKGFNNELKTDDGKEIPKDIKQVLSISRQKALVTQLLRQKANFGPNDENLQKGENNKAYTNALVSFQNQEKK